MDDKRGQVTMFVLLGVLVILIIGLFFFFTYKPPITSKPPSTIPRTFVERCVIDSVQPSINSVLEYGGLIAPRNYIKKSGHEYNYLCFTDVYYEKCTQNYPMLHRITTEEIRKDSFSRVDGCFDYLIDDYKSRGYEVTDDALNYTVELVPGSVRLRIHKKMVVSKGDDTQTFDNFDMSIPSDLYDLLRYTRSIVNAEAEYCYFENNGFMILYPKYNLTRVDFVESKIYQLQNRQTKEVFKFAIRSCPFAPGFINAPR